MSGWKSESELLDALRAGTVERVAEALKRLYDARRGYDKLARRVPPRQRAAVEGLLHDLGGVAFQVASLQAEFVGRLVGVAERHNARVEGQVGRLLGLDTPRPGVRRESLVLTAQGDRVSTRFRLKHQADPNQGPRAVSLEHAALKLRSDKGKVVKTQAAFKVFSHDQSQLKAGEVGLVELTLLPKTPLKKARVYTTRVTFCLGVDPVLELDITVRAAPPPESGS
ncbi:MAG: hypothetical protein JNK72_15385 [Myxococcales bacterium]|nr:hypothetical protein [Myxococcales bacterium]